MRKLIILILLLFLTLPLIKADPCVGDYLGESTTGEECFSSCASPCNCYYKDINGAPYYVQCQNEEDYCITFNMECTYTPSGGGEPPPVDLPPFIYNVENNYTDGYASPNSWGNFSWFTTDFETNVDTTWFIDYFKIANTYNETYSGTRYTSSYVGSNYYRGQSFYFDIERYIQGACLNLNRNPSYSGWNVTYSLYLADAVGLPSGNALMQKNVTWNEFPNVTTANNKTCTLFDGVIKAIPNQKYAIVASSPGAPYNAYSFGIAYPGNYAKGTFVYSGGGSSWSYINYYDSSNFTIIAGDLQENITNFAIGDNGIKSSIIKKIFFEGYNEYKICANDTAGNVKCLNFTIYTTLTAPTGDTTPPKGTMDIPLNGINVNNYVTIDGDVWDEQATTCTQTRATASSVCGGVAFGTQGTTNYVTYGATWYNTASLYDDNWNTVAYGSSPSLMSYMNITYQKPSGALNTSKWHVKDQNKDIQLPIPSHCWNANATYLKFRAGSRYYSPNGLNTWECWNETGWTIMRNWTYDYEYDEEMIWSIYGRVENQVKNASVYWNNGSGNNVIDGCSNLDVNTFDCIWNIKNETIFPSGIAYNITLTACDYSGNCNNSISVKSVTIDREEARIANKTIIYPTGQESAKYGDLVQFSFTTGDNETNISYAWANFTILNKTEVVEMSLLGGTNSFGNWSIWGQNATINTTNSYIPLGVSFYVNDSSNPPNIKEDVALFIIDNQAPIYSGFDYFPKTIYNLSNFSVILNAKDNYKLKWYNFSYSGTASGSISGDFNISYLGQEKSLVVIASVETGDYNITIDLYDDAGNKNTTSQLNFSVLNEELGLVINLMYPEDGASVTSPTAFGWNYTGGDADTCWLYINNSRVNYTISPLNNTELNWTNSTDSSTNWMVSCNVSDGSEYYSLTRDFVLSEGDTTYPTFSTYTYNVTNGSQFNPTQIYQFNATIKDANGTAWLEFNGTNYTATNISDVYSVVIGTIPAGVYDYNWSAFSNGSNHFRNSSSVQSYTILQNNSYVLGITATTPITYGTTTDAVGTGCPTQLSCALNISNAVYPAGITNFNYSTAGNVNYSGNSTLKAVTINKLSTTINLYINGTEDNLVVEYPSPTINTTCIASNTQGELNITRNSTLVSNGTSPINYTASLERGSYNLTCYYTATQNYTGASKSFVLNVSDTTAPTISNLANFSKWTNESMGYDFDATDADGFSINDTRFEINSTGYFKNVSAITTAGLIWINISVNDSSNNLRYDKFYVNYTALPDTTSPYFTYTANQSVYLNTSIGVDFNATDETSFGCFAVNDTRFNINCSGWLKNTTALSVGLIWINITINDSSNNLNSTIIFVNVTAMPDLTPPTWTSLTNKTCYVNKSCTHTISATDTSGIGIYKLNDTTIFSIGNTTGIIVNATKLTNVTLYNLNVSVNDTKGNIATGVFWINVTAIPSGGVGNVTVCRYKKLGVYNVKLPWMRETNCV